MISKSDPGFPNFRLIREAILTAPAAAAGFPLDALRDAGVRQQLRAAPYLEAYLREMRAEATRAQETPLELLSFSRFQLFETSGDRSAFEHVYFDRRRRVAGLTLTSIIDETDDYLTALNDLLWEICSEYTWSLPAHLPVGVEQVKTNRVPPEQVVDLFAAHTAHMLAEVMSLLGDRLPDWLRYRIRVEIERRVFQPVFHDPVHFWWESAPMNWASVCAGCTGMAALILVEDREQLAGMIDRVIRTMECFLDGFGADGGCPEGISYWVYGFGFFTYFAEMLSTFTAGRIDLLRNERVRQIAHFPQVVSLGEGRYINFSDAPEETVIHSGLGSRLSTYLQKPIPDLRPPRFLDDHIFRWGHITCDLLWTEISTLEQPVKDGSFYLNDLAWVVDRRTLDGITVAFAAKGGHNDEPHNHNDLGHFILHLSGESLLVDPGAGLYTRQYFGEQRYEFLHTGSQGHSVPTINGLTQKAGADYRAIPLRYESHGNGLTFGLDLTGAYVGAGLESYVRFFDWSVDSLHQTADLKLTDTFRFVLSQGQVEECFISFIQPTIVENTVIWKGTRCTISLQFDPQVYTAGVQAVETQMHHGKDAVVYRFLLLALQPGKTLTSTFLFQCNFS